MLVILYHTGHSFKLYLENKKNRVQSFIVVRLVYKILINCLFYKTLINEDQLSLP